MTTVSLILAGENKIQNTKFIGRKETLPTYLLLVNIIIVSLCNILFY